MICDMCHQEKECSHEPSRRQLLFGGWNVTYENRCRECEREVIKMIQGMIREKPAKAR